MMGSPSEEGFGYGGLVDLTGEQEIGFGGWDRARHEGDDGGRSEMERCEERKSVAGISLDAHHYGLAVSLVELKVS